MFSLLKLQFHQLPFLDGELGDQFNQGMSVFGQPYTEAYETVN
jgi:hypothetical protein